MEFFIIICCTMTVIEVPLHHNYSTKKIGDINMFTTVSLIVMLIVGTVFSIWMAKHDNLEVS